MIQLRKKGFTLIEVLTVMLIAIPVLAILYVLLNQTLNMYDSVKESAEPIGAQTSLIADIEDLSRDCDYVEVIDGAIIFYNDDASIKIDPVSYNLSASFVIDYDCTTIKITVGGEEHCIRYLQKINP